MPTYNRVHSIKTCTKCEKDYSVIREIKYGYIWCMHYSIGDPVDLDGRENITVEQLKNIDCPHCSGNSEFDITVRNGKIHRTPRRVRHYIKMQRKLKVKA